LDRGLVVAVEAVVAVVAVVAAVAVAAVATTAVVSAATAPNLSKNMNFNTLCTPHTNSWCLPYVERCMHH
jgi:hypothetical protein